MLGVGHQSLGITLESLTSTMVHFRCRRDIFLLIFAYLSTECSLCQDTILSKRAVEELADQSQHHLNIRITRPLSDQNTIGVKVTPLFRDCPDCPAVLNKKQLRKIKTMVLPEGCNCETFQRQGKYVLLTSGVLQENGQFHLQSNDVLLPPKNAKIVRNVFEQWVASTLYIRRGFHRWVWRGGAGGCLIPSLTVYLSHFSVILVI